MDEARKQFLTSPATKAWIAAVKKERGINAEPTTDPVGEAARQPQYLANRLIEGNLSALLQQGCKIRTRPIRTYDAIRQIAVLCFRARPTRPDELGSPT